MHVSFSATTKYQTKLQPWNSYVITCLQIASQCWQSAKKTYKLKWKQHSRALYTEQHLSELDFGFELIVQTLLNLSPPSVSAVSPHFGNKDQSKKHMWWITVESTQHPKMSSTLSLCFPFMLAANLIHVIISVWFANPSKQSLLDVTVHDSELTAS